MEKVIIIVLFVLCICNSSYSQVYVDGKNINELPEVKYCQVLIIKKGFSPKVIVNIDYGQEKGDFGKKNSLVENNRGKKIFFNTSMDVMNFMAYNGWNYVDAFAFNTEGQDVYHYIFEKN